MSGSRLASLLFGFGVGSGAHLLRLRVCTSLVFLVSLTSSQGISQEETLDLAFGRRLTIGVVRDGPSPGDTLPRLIEDELRTLLGSNAAQITFKTAPQFDAGWQGARMGAALQAALDDPAVDLVLTTGLLITQAATRMELNKPVVSAYVQRADLFRAADTEANRSQKANLSFVLIAQRAEGDLRAISELVLTDTVHLALPQEYADQYARLSDEKAALESASGLSIALLRIGPDVAASLAAVGEEVTALVLASTPRLSIAERKELIEGFTAEGIPTFSLLGHEDVKIGALAARTPDITSLVARRAALNLSELIRGADVSSLPVLLSADPRFLVNGRTAVAVGYRPTIRTRSYASFLHEDALALDEAELPLADALEMAERSNPTLAISSQNVETALRDKQLARSPMFPQIAFNPQFFAIDPAGLNGLIPEKLLNARFLASQMIYDDKTGSSFRSSSRQYEGSQLEYQSDRYDILESAGVQYMRFALSRVLYQIDLSNLHLTEENLELAKFRADVGFSGRDEVYRWEAELASRRSDLFASIATIEAERVALNQILGVEQGRRFAPEEMTVDPDTFPFLGGELSRYTTDAVSQRRMQEFAVTFAFENSPEIGAIYKNIEAQEIQLGQASRRWWLPSFSLSFQYDYHLEREPALEEVSKSIPSMNVAAVYPIFTGGARSYDVSRNRSQLTRLLEQERLTRDLIERRTRTVMARLESSFASIEFTQVAADNAARNLDIVQDKYAQGLVNVTDLLEAQNESFRASHAEAAATYRFLIDLISFQRAITWFEFEKTAEERDELLQRMVLAAQGAAPQN
jgi:outer membrane protein TolC